MTSLNDWLATHDCTGWKDTFEKQGYLVVKDLLNCEELKQYQDIYNKFLSDEIKSSSHRHDLGSHVERKVQQEENICQVMWPSKFIETLKDGMLHQKAQKIAKILLGDDIEFDFDMLISKAPHTDTVTPMHQDESYWLDMPDKRAASVWVAMDNATIDNGCMWFVPGSHKQPLRAYRKAARGHHALRCDGDESELVAAPIQAGSCTVHHGRTIHYTRGNSTDHNRRAFIVNLRPGSMVDWEREHGYDHGKSKGVADIVKDD